MDFASGYTQICVSRSSYYDDKKTGILLFYSFISSVRFTIIGTQIEIWKLKDVRYINCRFNANLMSERDDIDNS